VSVDLAAKIQLGLDEFETVHRQLEPLIAKTVDSNVGDIETAAACAMLHSFYTEIEKMLKLIAREWDARIPSSDAWHKELLNQMAVPTNTRPAVITSGLVEILSEFLAFRHLFRGASIALMRWDKLAPLVAKVDQTYVQTRQELETFQTFLRSQSRPS
jgi:ribonuclease HepT-like protein